MRKVLETKRCILMHGDASELCLQAESVDAMVTDPPSGIGFMGKGWDSDKGGRDAWIAWLEGVLKPAFAALKPGAHALVWALPRTSHWTATALENLGFEIRDIHMHVFGSGFPKSLDVSKAIDQKLGVERPVVGSVDQACGVYAHSGSGTPQDIEKYAKRNITGPGSPEAARWEGWGTALKPAAEHWILCRKPLAGTVAGNVLAHSTGGLNIDACRINTDDELVFPAIDQPRAELGGFGLGVQVEPEGRWPAHVSFDEEAAAMLDAQSGVSRDRVAVNRNRTERKASAAGFAPSKIAGTASLDTGYGGKGGASRFFYVAKPSRSEKEAGLAHLAARTAGEATDREEGSAGLDNPRAGAGRTGGAKNFHPTVKSIALMRWLIRLITPPGGLVLDPFCGSGTTGVAALAEGARFVGVELTDEYIPIAMGRLEYALGELF